MHRRGFIAALVAIPVALKGLWSNAPSPLYLYTSAGNVWRHQLPEGLKPFATLPGPVDAMTCHGDGLLVVCGGIGYSVNKAGKVTKL